MITREQVADLQPGDVVSIAHEDWPPGTEHGGPLWVDANGNLRCAHLLIRYPEGHGVVREKATLTVVSRAPRPLYVNHPRTEPVPGDVVRAADGEGPETYHYVRLDFGAPWGITTGPKRFPREHLPARLRLLVDGETGQVVP